MNPVVKAHIALLFVSLFYGMNYSIAKIVMDDNYIQPLGFILLRVSTATILFWIFHALFVKEKVAFKDFGLLILCAVFGIAINQMFFFMGLARTTPINASLIMTINPILVLISSALLIGEKVTVRKMIGILIGCVGAAWLITYGKRVNFESEGLLGDLLVLINATSYAIYLVIVKSLIKKYHPITVVKWLFFFGFFMVLPFGWKDLSTVQWTAFTLPVWLAVVYVLIFTTFVVYLLNAYALSIVNASTVSIYIYLQPLVASITAILMQKDILTLPKILAGLLIFVGVYLVSIQKRSVNTA